LKQSKEKYVILQYFLFFIAILIKIKKNKGYKMSVLIKNAESLFQKFENIVEDLARKLF